MNEIEYSDITLSQAQTIPVSTANDFITFVDMPAATGIIRDVLVAHTWKNGIDEFKECRDTWPRAVEAVRMHENSERLAKPILFRKKVDRIQVVTLDCGDNVVRTHLTCYNLEKAAAYGICQTYEDAPYHWGFCSRSCNYTVDRTPVLPSEYEETKLILHEIPPPGSNLESGNNFSIQHPDTHIHNVAKWI